MAQFSSDMELDIAKGLSRFADFPFKKMSPDTRLYHDAGLAGDDFAEFIEWFWVNYRVPVPGRLTDYCPSEGQVIWGYFPWNRTKPFVELRISDLAQLAAGNSTI